MKKEIKIYHWMPRLLCILALLFISMFSLDAFEPGKTLWQQLIEFVLHMTPTWILLAILLVAWKWEKTGGWIFLILGIIFTVLVFNLNYHRTHAVLMCIGIVSMVSLPFVLVGVLFLISDRKKKQMARRLKFIERANARS